MQESRALQFVIEGVSEVKGLIHPAANTSCPGSLDDALEMREPKGLAVPGLSRIRKGDVPMGEPS